MSNKTNDELKSSQNKPPKNSSIWRWILTVVAIGFFAYQFSRQDFKETFTLIRELPSGTILLSILSMLGSRIFIGARWNALLKINDPKPNFKEILKITFAGLFSTNVLPTSIGGDVVRLFMGIQASLEPAYVTSSLIMDRIIGFTGMFFFLPYGITIFLRSPENPFISHIIMVVPMAIVFSDLFKKLWEWGKKFILRVANSFRLWWGHPIYLLESMGFTLLHMAFYFMTIWLCLHAMHADLSILKIGAIYSLSYIISLFPLSIGGLGIQELAISYLFSSLGNVPSESAYALALLIRLAFIICSLPGIFFLPDLGKIKREKQTQDG
ncbi:MAG: flippase-like domain-containing protein [Chloroflexi bacterium]|nr:flippase-like domain-containing protein [Chloroflexota bacterium]